MFLGMLSSKIPTGIVTNHPLSLIQKKLLSIGQNKNMIFGWIFSSEMALLVIFRPIFRGFCSATLKWFEITSPDLLSNLSLIIGEVHEKNLRSGREQRCCGPSKFACRRFLPLLTLTLQRLQIITFFINEIMTWDFCRPKIQHCMPPTVYIW